MTVAVALALTWGCAVAPSPSASPPTASSSVVTISPGSATPAAITSARAGLVPPLLLAVSAGDRAGLWRIDPNTDPSAPSWAARIGAPPGRWRPTSPAPGGLIALTSVGETPIHLALARLTLEGVTPIWVATLPSGDRWADSRAECLSPPGVIALGDAGLTLYVMDSRQELAIIPGQRNNLGECTWIGPETLLWDQEEGPLASWKVGDDDVSSTQIQHRDPSAGGNRLAWFDDATATVRVATIRVSGSGLQIVRDLGHVEITPNDYPADLALSPDGSWLMMLANDELSILSVTSAGLVEEKGIPVSSIPLALGDIVTWMPSPS